MCIPEMVNNQGTTSMVSPDGTSAEALIIRGISCSSALECLFHEDVVKIAVNTCLRSVLLGDALRPSLAHHSGNYRRQQKTHETGDFLIDVSGVSPISHILVSQSPSGSSGLVAFINHSIEQTGSCTICDRQQLDLVCGEVECGETRTRRIRLFAAQHDWTVTSRLNGRAAVFKARPTFE